MTFIATISKASKKGGRAFADLADICFENGGTPNFETSEPVSIIAPHGVTLKNGMKVRFKSVTEDRERKGDALQARGVSVIVDESPAEVAVKAAPAQVVERSAAQVKKPVPPVIKNPNIVNETKPVESEALYARIEEDPEARLKGTEAVLVSKTDFSSETAWATIRPAVVGLGKILWQLLLGAIDLGRWLWKAGKNFIADRRARKSAA